jgi:hypothetical protein
MRRANPQAEQAMTVRDPAHNFTFEAVLVEDGRHTLWLHQPDRQRRQKAKYLVSAVLKLGWQIVYATPAEWDLLHEHGFATGRVQ